MVKRKRSTTQSKAQPQPISAKEMTLPISALRLDFQPQDKYPLQEDGEEGSVQDYVNLLRRGEIPPPVLVRFDGTNYFLEDGFHRVEAMKRVHKRRIKALVRLGTLADIDADWWESMRRLNEALKLPVQI